MKCISRRVLSNVSVSYAKVDIYTSFVYYLSNMVKTLNISLPKTLIEEADRVARSRETSRSELIRESLRAYLLRARMLEEVFKAGKKTAKKYGLKTEEDVYRFLER